MRDRERVSEKVSERQRVLVDESDIVYFGYRTVDKYAKIK